MNARFFDLVSTAQMVVLLVTLVVGIGLAAGAMQRGRPAILPMMAFVIAIVGILANRIAVA